MKLVILDRDGVINEDRDDFVKNTMEWQPLPKSCDAIANLTQAGWHVVVATNQSGIGRGLFDMASLNAVHARMQRELAAVGGRVEAVFLCPHAPEDNCDCRKPRPGLFRQIGARFGVSLADVPAAGNTLRHVTAAAAAGCPAHLLLTGPLAGLASADVQAMPDLPPGTRVHADLGAFADWLLSQPTAPKTPA